MLRAQSRFQVPWLLRRPGRHRRVPGVQRARRRWRRRRRQTIQQFRRHAVEQRVRACGGRVFEPGSGRPRQDFRAFGARVRPVRLDEQAEPAHARAPDAHPRPECGTLDGRGHPLRRRAAHAVVVVGRDADHTRRRRVQHGGAGQAGRPVADVVRVLRRRGRRCGQPAPDLVQADVRVARSGRPAAHAHPAQTPLRGADERPARRARVGAVPALRRLARRVRRGQLLHRADATFGLPVRGGGALRRRRHEHPKRRARPVRLQGWLRRLLRQPSGVRPPRHHGEQRHHPAPRRIRGGARARARGATEGRLRRRLRRMATVLGLRQTWPAAPALLVPPQTAAERLSMGQVQYERVPDEREVLPAGGRVHVGQGARHRHGCDAELRRGVVRRRQPRVHVHDAHGPHAGEHGLPVQGHDAPTALHQGHPNPKGRGVERRPRVASRGSGRRRRHRRRVARVAAPLHRHRARRHPHAGPDGPHRGGALRRAPVSRAAHRRDGPQARRDRGDGLLEQPLQSSCHKRRQLPFKGGVRAVCHLHGRRGGWLVVPVRGRYSRAVVRVPVPRLRSVQPVGVRLVEPRRVGVRGPDRGARKALPHVWWQIRGALPVHQGHPVRRAVPANVQRHIRVRFGTVPFDLLPDAALGGRVQDGVPAAPWPFPGLACVHAKISQHGVRVSSQ